MADYHITPSAGGDSFDVRIVGSNGARRTILGFASQHEAETWVMQDKRLNDAADPFKPARSKTPAGR